MRLIALTLAALALMLAAPSVMADEPAVSVSVWHPDQWAVVTASDTSLVHVAYFPDLAAAKRGINTMHPTRIEWHDVFQATADTACGTFTAEETNDTVAIGSVTNLTTTLDCPLSAPATVRFLA